MLLRQQFDLQVVVPLVINKLSKDVLLENNITGNKIIINLLKIDKEFSEDNIELRNSISMLIDKEIDYIQNLNFNQIDYKVYSQNELQIIVKLIEKLKAI